MIAMPPRRKFPASRYATPKWLLKNLHEMDIHHFFVRFISLTWHPNLSTLSSSFLNRCQDPRIWTLLPSSPLYCLSSSLTCRHLYILTVLEHIPHIFGLFTCCSICFTSLSWLFPLHPTPLANTYSSPSTRFKMISWKPSITCSPFCHSHHK